MALNRDNISKSVDKNKEILDIAAKKLSAFIYLNIFTISITLYFKVLKFEYHTIKFTFQEERSENN